MQNLLHRNVNDLEPSLEELRALTHLVADIVFDARAEYESLEEYYLINGIEVNENVKKDLIEKNPLGSKSVQAQLVTMDSFMRSVCEYVFSAGDLTSITALCGVIVYEQLNKEANWDNTYSIIDDNRFSYSRILLEMIYTLGTYDNLRALYFLYKSVGRDNYGSFKDIDSSAYFDEMNDLIKSCTCDKAALASIQALADETTEGNQ